MGEPLRERWSVGCGAALGVVSGFVLAVQVTATWASPGAWYEWPLAIAVIGVTTLLCGWAVGRWGSTAVAVALSVFSWC